MDNERAGRPTNPPTDPDVGQTTATPTTATPTTAIGATDATEVVDTTDRARLAEVELASFGPQRRSATLEAASPQAVRNVTSTITGSPAMPYDPGSC